MSILNFASLSLFSGDSWMLKESLKKYPAPDNQLSILLKHKTDNAVTLTFLADGTDHILTVTPDKTNLPSGLYYYQAKITAAGLTNTIEIGTISILPNLSTQDPRGEWAVIADELMDIYRKLSNREVMEATYNGRTFKYKDTWKLLGEIEYAKEMAGISQPTPIIRERC